MSHCCAAFQFQVNNSLLHQQILTASSKTPLLEVYMLNELAKLFHEKFLLAMKGVHDASRGLFAPTPSAQQINDVERQVMYYQAGWIITDIKFAELSNITVVTRTPQ